MNSSSPTLREAAILLSQLDRQTSELLLDGLPEDEASILREAVRGLDGLETHEVRQILRVFLESGEAQDMVSGIEVDASLREHFAHPRETAPASPDHEGAWDFLQRIDTKQLGKRLSVERPQTTAVVVTQLEPRRAAAVLGHLPPERRAQVVRCLTHLEDQDFAVLEAVRATLVEEFLSASSLQATKTVGRRVAQAIADASPVALRQELSEHLEAAPAISICPRTRSPHPFAARIDDPFCAAYEQDLPRSATPWLSHFTQPRADTHRIGSDSSEDPISICGRATPQQLAQGLQQLDIPTATAALTAMESGMHEATLACLQDPMRSALQEALQAGTSLKLSAIDQALAQLAQRIELDLIP